MRKNYFLPVLFGLLFSLSSTVYAHGGGVDSQGCHTNAQTGQHHCHTAKPDKRKPNNTIIEVPASGVSSFVSGKNQLTTAIQKELVRLGYFPGNTVGYADSKTIIAIKFFQEDIKLKPTGEPNQELLRLMQSYQP